MAKKKPTRSAAEIEADIVASRDRLGRTVDELAFRASPAELKRKGVAALKDRGNAVAFTEDGELRMDRVAGLLGGVGGAALLLGTARRVFHRG